MSNFAKPSLKELRNRAISNINTYLQGADANLRRRILNVFATIFAAMGDEVLRRVDYLLKQLFIQTADEEYLIKHGQTKRFPRKMPSKAEGPASFPATAGSVIPAGTKIKRTDNVTYSTKAERTVGADRKPGTHRRQRRQRRQCHRRNDFVACLARCRCHHAGQRRQSGHNRRRRYRRH